MNHFKKPVFLCALYLAVLPAIYAQQLVSTAGDFSEVSTGSISWSIGEIVTETINHDNSTLTQGFQQSSFKIITLSESDEFKHEIKVFPIPATEYLTVEIKEFEKDFQLILFNVLGEKVLTKQVKSQKTTLYLDQLPSSEYILNIENGESKLIKSFIIIKH